MSFRIRDVENVQRSHGMWPEQLCPALGNVTNAALILPEILCLLSSLSLFHVLWYQTRSLSAERFPFWRKGRAGISACGKQQFLLFLVMVAPASWPSQHLALQGCVWQAWAQLCGTNSDIHVLTGFLCFVQMDRRPVTASIILDCPASKNPWHAAFPSALDAVVHYKMLDSQQQSFSKVLWLPPHSRLCCVPFFGLSWISGSPLFWSLKFSSAPWKPAGVRGSCLFAALVLVLFILVGVAPRSDTAKSSGQESHLVP